MRKTILMILVAASVLLIALGAAQILGADPTTSQLGSTVGYNDGVARITVEDLHARLAGPQPPVVWDIRTADAFALGHIQGAQLVAQLGQVAGLAASLDRNRPIVTLCA